MGRAYHERAKSTKHMNVPAFRRVVRVSSNRVYYRREDDERVRSLLPFDLATVGRRLSWARN